jgi:hypothetical protein
MLRTPGQALEFVRTHGIVTMTGSSRPSLVEAVAGGPVGGSWWGHPKGGVMYRLADALHESPEVLSLKLVDGKVTFVHRALWPALARVVTDPGRRTTGLKPAAKRLLKEVEKRGSVRLDQATARSKGEIEKSLLAHSGSVHTEKGSHATVLTAWSKVFDARTRQRARKFSLAEALNLLGLAPIP